jgi:hypothetical protein
MPAHGRSKNGVATLAVTALAYVAGSHVFMPGPFRQVGKDVDGRNRSGHDVEWLLQLILYLVEAGLHAGLVDAWRA